MRLSILGYFLTLVLSANSVFAAPQTVLQTDRVEPQHTSNSRVNVYKTFRPTQSLRLGYGTGKFNTDDTKENAGAVGWSNLWWQPNNDIYELGLEYITTSKLRLLGNYRSFLFSADYYGLYYKVGFEGVYLPSELIASTINFRRYFASAGVGMMDLFRLQKRLGLEISAAAGPPGSHFNFMLNWNY